MPCAIFNKGVDFVLKKFACIDIGGTAIKYGIVNDEARLLFQSETPTEALNGGTFIMEKVKKLIYQMKNDHNLSGICISTAGMVDREGTIFHSASLIPEYIGTPVKQIMEKEFFLPCEVENDVRCAGLAEAISGAALGSESALCLTIGTGVGGCVILGGKIWHGFSGSAGEIGYIHMDNSSFQELGAGSVLVKNTEQALNLPQGSLNGKIVFKKAAEGDTVCIEMINRMTDVLGKGIANLCYLLNPETVVVGGGVTGQGEPLRAELESAMKRYLLPVIADKTKLVFAKHGNDAGMLGAFYHFKQLHPEGGV